VITQNEVNDALNCAIESDHSFDGWTDEDIAHDMIAYDAFEVPFTAPVEELITMVRVWRAAQEQAAA
jgi:hypothetical protein